MGMSASQVRFLSLQSRKNDVGRQLMSLSNRKMSLSRDMNKVSQNYTQALNQKMLKWSNDSGATYNTLSYDLMMKPNDLNSEVPYIVSTRDGRVVVDNTQNLLGAVGGTYTTLDTGVFSTNAPANLQGKPLTYANIAQWITEAQTLDGSTGTLYTTTEGLQAGTGNRGAYVVPQGALNYGFENTLRYQIFEELGLVSTDTTDEYKKLIEEMYGSEEAYKKADYATLLSSYVAQGRAAGTHDLTGINLTQNGVNYGNYQKYFGYIDATTGTWAVDPATGKTIGSLQGNLELAKFAVTEYDNWCNELKEFNLDSDTTFTFNSTSGRSNTQVVQGFLKMNNNVDGVSGTSDDSMGIANDFQVYHMTYEDGTIAGTIFDPAWIANEKVHSGSNKIVNWNWADIYTTGDVDVELNNSVNKAGLAQGFLEGFHKSLTEGNTATSVEGNAWTLYRPDKTKEDYVDDGNGNMIPLSDAAHKFAIDKSTNYFGTLEAYANNYGGCGSCHSDGHFYNCAGSAGGNTAENNVLGRSNSGRCFWHAITHFIGGFFATIGCGLWTALTAIATAGFAPNTSAVVSGWDTFTDSWQGDGAKYTLNMANVQKTYLTYYQMYMDAYQDGFNLLLGEGATSNVSKTAVTNNVAYLQAMSEIGNNGGTTLAAYTTITNADLSITYRYNDTTLNGTQEFTMTAGTATDGNGTVHNVTNYDNYYGTFSGGKVQIITTGDETSGISSQETYVFNSPRSATSVDVSGAETTVQFNKIVVNTDASGNQSIRYYMNGSEVQITKIQTTMTDEYGDLKVAAWDTKHTNTISAYITPDKPFRDSLEDDVKKAQEAIDELNERMKNFFGAKETKLMDYYDAIFLRIAENGWVNDNKVNNQQIGREYLNNKFMNNDYFVTVCKERNGDPGFNYTNKMASTVIKIFEVNDTEAQNEALSKYEYDKTLISNKERRVDAMMKKLETEQEAINTEMESVKKIVDENIDKTFKMFA